MMAAVHFELCRSRLRRLVPPPLPMESRELPSSDKSRPLMRERMVRIASMAWTRVRISRLSSH
jgi:hypothetical protein